mmetsp:Transcript_2222/g.8167  ORF Transcript_2222/g.8167 Transcript_2222/m.8167 type:complete len:105 (-) Transcript_2222:4769-5083(-)
MEIEKNCSIQFVGFMLHGTMRFFVMFFSIVGAQWYLSDIQLSGSESFENVCDKDVELVLMGSFSKSASSRVPADTFNTSILSSHMQGHTNSKIQRKNIPIKNTI